MKDYVQKQQTLRLLIQHETTTDGVKDRETREELFTHTHTNDLKILKQKLVDLLHVLNISTLNLYSALAETKKQTNQNLLIPKAW